MNDSCVDVVEELFEVLGPMNERERTAYLRSHQEIPVDSAQEAQRLLDADRTATELPRLECLLPEPELSAEELKPGDMLGSYRLVRRIGSGGMGVVYEAIREDGDIRLNVCVKVLHAELRTREFLENLRREVAALASLVHPNIARLLDWNLDDEGKSFFVMEHIDGEPLIRYCSKRGLTIRDRLRVFSQVGEAVNFAHQHLIAHLDLKPANVLVNSSGEVKLLDFGISRSLKKGEGQGHTSLFRAFSEHYASPEQVCGEAVSGLSDVYSLGAVLQELLDGDAMQRANATPLPSEVAAIISRAMALEPANRYSSAKALTEDLRCYLYGYCVKAVPRRPAYVARKFLRRNALELAIVCVIAVSVATGLVAWRMRHNANEEHERAERLSKSVHQLSMTLLSPLEEQMRSLPGATPARKLAVETGLEFLQGLSADAERDPRLAVEIGEAYMKLGDIQGNPANSNLGDDQGARKSYETARALLAHGASRYSYGVLLTHEGDLVSVDGDDRTAVQMYKEAIAALSSAEKANPKDLRVKEALEPAFTDLGDLQSAGGDDKLARANYDQAYKLAKELNERQPQSVDYSRELARCSGRYGDLDVNAGNWRRAAMEYRRSLVIYDRLLGENPDNLKVRRSWIAGANNVAYTDEELGNLGEAIDLYRKASKIAALTVNIDPRNATASRDEQVSYSNMTRLYLKLDRITDAEASCRHELALAQALWYQNRQSATAADDLAGSKEHLAEIHQKKREFAEAVRQEKEALKLLYDNLHNSGSLERVGAVVDGLVRQGDYDLESAEAYPAKAEFFLEDARKTLSELHRLESQFRPNNAEDRKRGDQIRGLAQRIEGLRKKRES